MLEVVPTEEGEVVLKVEVEVVLAEGAWIYTKSGGGGKDGERIRCRSSKWELG